MNHVRYEEKWEELKPPFYNSLEEYTMAYEERLENIEKDINNIKTNHLPDIYKMLRSHRDKLLYILGAMAVLIPLVITILSKVW